MSESTARVDPSAGPVRIELALGDGVISEWTVRLEGDGTATRTWSGNTRDPLPDVVELPGEALVGGAQLSWVAIFFGSHEAMGFHYGIRVKQDGRNVLVSRLRGSGTVKARKTKVRSGTISVEVGP